jgi:hypothetical protein
MCNKTAEMLMLFRSKGAFAFDGWLVKGTLFALCE